MQKNFTNLFGRAITAKLLLNATAGLLWLFLMLVANAVSAQTITSIAPTCATVGESVF